MDACYNVQSVVIMRVLIAMNLNAREIIENSFQSNIVNYNFYRLKLNILLRKTRLWLCMPDCQSCSLPDKDSVACGGLCLEFGCVECYISCDKCGQSYCNACMLKCPECSDYACPNCDEPKCSKCSKKFIPAESC